MTFRIASSPFTHNRQSTGHIMSHVILACLPGLLALVWFFGYGTLVQLLLASTTALLAEGLIMKLRKKPALPRLMDYSALLTAVLLALSLPPATPWWMIVLATCFAIIIAKQLYGGLGHNPFNPAMVGYVVLLISFPVQMTSWLPSAGTEMYPAGLNDTLAMIFAGRTAEGLELQQLRAGYDGMTQATPLDALKTGMRSGKEAGVMVESLYFGVRSGISWAWVNAGFLLGGLYLLWRRIISWQIPASFLAVLALCAGLGEWLSPTVGAPTLVHLFSGATMLGAFFIATDPVTASTTDKGRLLFGAMTGLLVWLIRTYGGYPDGVAFAVLLANICVPLIDYYTQPRAYGHR